MSSHPERANGSPAWSLLASTVAPSPPNALLGPGDVAVCELPDRRGRWREALDTAIEDVPPGDVLVVAADRGWSAALFTLLSRRSWGLRRTPSLRQVRRALRSRGMTIEATHAVWPSARIPRIVLPRSELRMMRWTQAAGLFEGSERPLLVQLLVRSVLFALLALGMPPAVALVARTPRTEIHDR